MPQTDNNTKNNAAHLRKTMGQFATGVTIITCHASVGPLGITANSFSTVSIDPPLILWSPAKTSKRHDAFVKAQHFAIHVLKFEQLEICSLFANNGNPFSDIPHEINQWGVPIISNSLAVFECRHFEHHSAGDHTVVLGEIERFSSHTGDPLIFCQGKYMRGNTP